MWLYIILEGNTCDTEHLVKLQRFLRDTHVVWHQWDCPRANASVKKCLKAYWQLRKLFKCYSFAWMHCHSPIGGALARIASHQAGVPVIYTAHGFHFYRGAPKRNWLLYYPAEKLLAYWTNILITVNQEDYRFAKQNLKAERICYISVVGIDTDKFGEIHDKQSRKRKREDIRKKNGIPQEAVLLLSVGELSSRKNHQLVISAMAQLKRKNVFYLICGQGMCRERLQRQAESLGVADRIRMPGFQDELLEIYHSADIFVFPSLQEGMPVALMEAMAAGLACIATDIRGNRELMTKQAGELLFHPDRKDQLVTCLHRLLENEWLRMEYGKRNLEKVKEYDFKIVERRMRHIYMHFVKKQL